MVRTAFILVVALMLFSRIPGHAASSLPIDPVPERIVVEKDDGTHIAVARVERWPGDFVRLISGTGGARYLPISTVRTIRDETGADVTERVLRGWEGFGTMPTAPQPSKRIPARYRQEFAMLQGGILGRTNPPSGEPHAALAIDLGTMRNLSTSLALGGTLGLVSDSDHLRIAAKPRLRQWLTNSVAFDVAPGIFHSVDSDNSSTAHGSVGFLLDTSFIFVGLAVTGQMEVVETKRRYMESKTEASYQLGLKTGGGVAVATSLVLMLAVAALGGGGETY